MKKGIFLVVLLILAAIITCACNIEKNISNNNQTDANKNIKEYDLFYIENQIRMVSNYFVTKVISAKKEMLRRKVISCRLFSVQIPFKLKELGEFKTKKDCISVYDRDSRENGFGGFAFSIKAYKNPSEYANGPGVRKIGELTNKKGELYDIVLIQPTDVQYDYTKEKNDSYMLLYNLGESVDIKGKKGCTYTKDKGMKGQDLYNEIIDKHITAINKKWDSVKLEQENMSYMYHVLAYKGNNILDKIGYTYYDVNGDGIEELLIGEIANGSWKGVIYDLYTMVNRKPAHVMSGGSRNRFFVSNDVFLCNEYSSGADESGWLIYILVENSTELFPQVGFKYDGYENKENPWFISYHFADNKWDNVSQQMFNERKKTFDRYKRFDYIPLSKFQKISK